MSPGGNSRPPKDRFVKDVALSRDLASPIGAGAARRCERHVLIWDFGRRPSRQPEAFVTAPAGRLRTAACSASNRPRFVVLSRYKFTTCNAAAPNGKESCPEMVHSQVWTCETAN